MDGLGVGFMADGFDVVPIRTNDEGSIVVRVVLRAQARSTIVFASHLKGSSVEVFDLLATLRREGQMQMCCLLLDPADAQRRLAVRAAKLHAEWTFRDNSYTKRCEYLEEERFALRVVADPEHNVIKHEPPELQRGSARGLTFDMSGGKKAKPF
jgi:hypothetical protein